MIYICVVYEKPLWHCLDTFCPYISIFCCSNRAIFRLYLTHCLVLSKICNKAYSGEHSYIHTDKHFQAHVDKNSPKIANNRAKFPTRDLLAGRCLPPLGLALIPSHQSVFIQKTRKYQKQRHENCNNTNQVPAISFAFQPHQVRHVHKMGIAHCGCHGCYAYDLRWTTISQGPILHQPRVLKMHTNRGGLTCFLSIQQFLRILFAEKGLLPFF